MSFKQFITDREGRGKCLTIREADNQADDVTELQYTVTALPRNLSQDEKLARISELVDTITNMPDSDVFLFSLWMGG